MRNFTYRDALKLVLATLLFYLANNVTAGVPLALSLFPAFCIGGVNAFALALLFSGVSFLSFPLQCALLLTASAFFLCLIFTVYQAKSARVRGELYLYTTLSLLPYIFGPFDGAIYQKLIYSAIIALFTLFFKVSAEVALVNKFKRKSSGTENASLCFCFIILSIGAIRTLSVEVWQCLALSALFLVCGALKNSKCYLYSMLLSAGIAIRLQDVTVIAVFAIFCSAALCFADYSKLLSALAILLAEVCVYYFSGKLLTFSLTDYLLTFAPVAIFLFTPSKLLRSLTQSLTRFEQPEITREIINLERGEVSARLNALSAVFCELENSVNCFDEIYVTKEQMVNKIIDEITLTVCNSCKNRRSCIKKNKPDKSDLKKLISVGISKGKITIIDLSRDLSSYCYSTNNMIYEVNRLLASYEKHVQNEEEVKKYKSLISLQANAVSNVLGNIAYEFSARVEFKKKNERKLFDALARAGTVPKQLVKTGNEYHLLFGRERVDYFSVCRTIGEITGEKLRLMRKIDLSEGILSVIAQAPELDAAFGVAQTTKADSELSGDTHSLTRINEGKFIIALCDGMGSGKKANRNSQTAISLFEAFYRTGLARENVLKLTNKLLSVCAEDSFCALDCAIIDLYEGFCDFIKVGAPHGFLLCEGATFIIENTALPLGILDEVTPSFCTHQISSGDMIVLLSDGITDAFFSSTDTVDFLTREKTGNPQVFADKILNHAVELNGGVAKDDMTALVVRIYQKDCA